MGIEDEPPPAAGLPDKERPALIRISRCPICGKPKEERFRPFCSKRCADLDLSRWFNGVYAAPAKEEDTEDEDF